MEIEIAAKLGASVFLIAVGRLAPWIWSRVQYHYARHFWRPVLGPQLKVVVGRHEFADFEPSGLIGVGDAKAVDVLREYFRKLYLPADFPVRYVDELPSGRSHDGTFLCLGGPNASPQGEGLIADLWRRAPTSFTWGKDSAEQDFVIYDHQSSEHIRPRGFPGTITRDYALIVRMLNPFAEPGAKEYALLFAGCFGFGTWGAARFATTAAFLKDRSVVRTEEFECLVSIDVANRSPGRTEMVAFRPLRRGRSQ